MRWSLPLGRIAGIDVRVHATFLLLVVGLGVLQLATGGSALSALIGIGFLLALFGCVLLHELGHALAARRYGIGTRDIMLLPIGGVARLERLPDRPSQELLVALAGPAVNAGLVLVLGVALFAAPASVAAPFVTQLLVANVFLTVFNLLPAFPMDGGRVLRALLAMRLGPVRSTRIAATIGKGMAFLFGIAGLFWNPLLLLIAIFVWFGAGQEERAITLRAGLRGVRARDVAVASFHVLDASESIARARFLARSVFQTSFPVTREGRLVGVVAARDLEGVNPFEIVEEVMVSPAPTLEEDEPVTRIFERQGDLASDAVIVVRSGRPVGLVPLGRLWAREAAASSSPDLRRAG
jgi:Zn-dependent protease/CBS domain-containing protein